MNLLGEENENDEFFELKNNEANDFNIATTDSNLIESADLFREPEEKSSKPRVHEKEKKYYAESSDFESGDIVDDSKWDTDIEIDNGNLNENLIFFLNTS